MEKYRYILFDLVSFIPITFYIVLGHKKVLRKNLGVLLFAIFFGIAGFFIVDIPAVVWGAWGYNYQYTLNILLPGSTLIEELIWAIFVAFLLGCFVVISAEREDRSRTKKVSPKRKLRK